MHFYSLIFSFAIIFTEVLSTDPHETIVRRTPSGFPYFLKSSELQRNLYTETGLIIFEFETADWTNRTNHWSNLLHRGFKHMKQDPLDIEDAIASLDCNLGDIFHVLYLTNQAKREFFQQLYSSCYSSKLMIHQLDSSFSNSENENTWRESLRECKSRRIPDSLISPDQLHKSLHAFFTIILRPAGLQPSFPLNKLSAYYKMATTSCTFSENSLIVAVQIPVITLENSASESTWRTYHIIPIPLWVPNEQDMVCYLRDRDGTDFLEGNYFYMGSTRTLVEPGNSCGVVLGSQPCFVSDRITNRSMKRNCIQAIVESLDEDIICTMKCEPSARLNFPVIRKVASDRYLIVADLKSNEDIRVECPPFQKEETLAFPVTGALEIILPCDCHIRYAANVFKAAHPCGAEFSKISISFPGTFDNRDGVISD